jgi:ankyrin repeat protein
MSFNSYDQDVAGSEGEIFQRYTLLGYAASYWAYHAQSISWPQSRNLDEILISASERFSSSAVFQRLLGAFWVEDGFLSSDTWRTAYFTNKALEQRPPYSLLHVAAYCGPPSVFRHFFDISNGVDINTQDAWFQTPLLIAAKKGYIDTLRLLFDRGAEIESKDNTGRTLLSWAARNSHTDVLLFLIDNGADIDSRDGTGRTLLSWTAEEGTMLVLRLLLEKGADIESKDNTGRTPLSRAAENGHTDVLELLFGQTVDINLKDSAGRTPLLFAIKNHHQAAIEFLRKSGARYTEIDDDEDTDSDEYDSDEDELISTDDASVYCRRYLTAFVQNKNAASTAKFSSLHDIANEVQTAARMAVKLFQVGCKDKEIAIGLTIVSLYDVVLFVGESIYSPPDAERRAD